MYEVYAIMMIALVPFILVWGICSLFIELVNHHNGKYEPITIAKPFGAVAPARGSCNSFVKNFDIQFNYLKGE